VAAKLGANLVSGFSWMGRVGPLFAIYLTTTILTALLSNGASVTIVYPIAKAMVSCAVEQEPRALLHTGSMCPCPACCPCCEQA
jgi:di/tricarboxylate transporter